jgi:hypothetical protein
MDPRIRKAAAWLQEQARPNYTEEYAMLLLGLKWTGADRAKISRFTKLLLGRQRENGGWAMNAYLPPTVTLPAKRFLRSIRPQASRRKIQPCEKVSIS